MDFIYLSTFLWNQFVLYDTAAVLNATRCRVDWLEFEALGVSAWLPTRLGVSGNHDDVIKWKHFPRYWPFVWGTHRSPVNSPHKGQWRGALMFSLISVWINGWVNNREAGDLRRIRPHYDVTVMILICWRLNYLPTYLRTWTGDYAIFDRTELMSRNAE